MPKLRELISVDPTLVHARGGDGQTPLEKGADIDARDIDHESTPLNTCCVSTRGVTILMIAKAWLAI